MSCKACEERRRAMVAAMKRLMSPKAEARARKAYYATRDAMGFSKPEWSELAEETRQHYRQKAR